jgi:hypothetical protein
VPRPSRRQRIRLHGALVLGLAVCTLGFTVELRRGLGGHLAAWVYVVEWPCFAVVGGLMWWRLLHLDDATGAEPAAASEPAPADVEDGGLTAWREYVARLEAGDGRPGPG